MAAYLDTDPPDSPDDAVVCPLCEGDGETLQEIGYGLEWDECESCAGAGYVTRSQAERMQRERQAEEA